MKKEYLLVILKHEMEALGAVRCVPGILVAEDEQFIYLRGIDDLQMQDKRLQHLPVLHSYLLDEEERMFPIKGATPIGKLQPMEWQPVTSFIKLELPVSALPGSIQNKLPISLVASEYATEGCAMMTKLSTWKMYAETASAVRLEHLAFAVASNGDVLIAGTPLPSIQGKEFYLQNEILLPAGYAFESKIIAEILQQKLNAGKENILLFTASGEWYEIPRSSFVNATRSGIRLTQIIESE